MLKVFSAKMLENFKYLNKNPAIIFPLLRFSLVPKLSDEKRGGVSLFSFFFFNMISWDKEYTRQRQFFFRFCFMFFFLSTSGCWKVLVLTKNHETYAILQLPYFSVFSHPLPSPPLKKHSTKVVFFLNQR